MGGTEGVLKKGASGSVRGAEGRGAECHLA